MLLKAIATVISTAFVTAGAVAIPAVGNAAYLVLNDSEMDQVTAGYDLTGKWAAPGGGTYYIRQLNFSDGRTGAKIYWYGESGSYANVASGSSTYPTSAVQATANVTFSGVPKNGDALGAGPLILSITDANHFTVQRGTPAPNAGAAFNSIGTFTRIP